MLAMKFFSNVAIAVTSPGEQGWCLEVLGGRKEKEGE